MYDNVYYIQQIIELNRNEIEYLENDEQAKTFGRTLTRNGVNKTTLRTAHHSLSLTLRMEKINNMTKHKMIEHPVEFDTRRCMLCARIEYRAVYILCDVCVMH